MIAEEGKYYLYRHIRLDINQPFYIGIGTQYQGYRHYSRAKNWHKNKYWENIVNKTEYKIEILLESDNYQFILEKEIEFVKLYGRKNNKTGILANETDGGKSSLGVKQSSETIEKRISKIRGKSRSLDFRQKLSEMHKGKTFCPECIEKSKKKIICTNKFNYFIKIFDSLSEASRELNIGTSTISKVCKGKNTHAKGYIFKYLNK